MAGEWTEKQLGEVIDIKHGFAFKGEFIRDEPEEDVLLTPGNFAIGGGFKAGKFKYYEGPVPNDFVLREGDLLVTMTDLSKQTDTLGYPAFVPALADGRRYLHNQRLGKVVLKDPSSLDIRFLHYLMCSKEYRQEVLASATGTTVRHTSPERIKRFRFKRPSLPEQRAIANILGTLDDKFELNRQMNRTLDSLVRTSFKSWFLDFNPVRIRIEGRQPDGPDAKTAALFPDSFLDSELGPIPKGWRVGVIGDVTDNYRRQVNPSELEVSTSYIGLEHMPRRSIALEDWAMSDGLASNKFGFERGEILFGKLRPYFQKVGVAPLDGVCSTDILVIGPREPQWHSFVLGHISSDELVAHADAASTGTRMPRTNWKDLSSYRIAIPPVDVASAFQMLASPLVEAVIRNVHESQTLAALRDTLLPKLISGEVRIRDAEQMAEATL